MLGDHVEFVLREFSGFQQHMVWRADLADIVHGAGRPNQIAAFAREPITAGQQLTVMAHALNVLGRRAVPVFRCNGEPLNRFFPGKS